MTITKNQISGLSILLLSKTFERTAFYLIMSILIQFLMTNLKLEVEKSGEFYSIFYGSIGFIALFSGLLGDLTNRIKVVKIGMLAMTILYFILIFIPNSYSLLLTCFVLLGISLGLNNTNINVFVGNIFNERNNQIFGISGFVFFSVVINIGALLAPMIASSLKESFGYNSVFIFAFLLSVVSCVLYFIFTKIYSGLDLFIEQKTGFETERKYRNLNLTIFLFIIILGVFIKFILNQRDLTFTFYVRDFVENGSDFSQTLEILEKYLSIVLLILFAGITIIIRKMNWNKVFKIILFGTILGLLGYTYATSLQPTENEKISQLPIFLIFLLLIVSETILYPTLGYMIYRSSPIRFKGLFQGISYTIVSSQLMFIGFMIYEKTNPKTTFLIFSIILLLSSISIVIFNLIANSKEAELLETNEGHSNQ